MTVIGIDLGTSNTCAAVVLDGQPQVIMDDKSHATMPSVMALTRRGQFIVGHMARAQLAVSPETTIHSAKRLIGQVFDSPDVQYAISALSANVCPDENGMPVFAVGDFQLSPIEVSAAVLKKVRVLASNALGEDITRAVISVPAHFDNVQRTSTKKAAEIAGFEVLRLINEPTSAALAYGYGSNETTHVIAVYDFGGGTFDISVLEIGDGIYNVLATGGDTFLGGNDFNKILADWLFMRFKQRTGIDLTQNPSSKQRVLDAAEFAKIQLSSKTVFQVEIKGIAESAKETLDLVEMVTRAQLEKLCLPLVERSLNICKGVFEKAGIDKSTLNDVVLVGGMTKMPLIREKVQAFFNKKPNVSINPDEAVAIGASIQAAALVKEAQNVLLLDVVPLTLGIEAAAGIFIPLIPKNTKIPHRVTRIFTTNRDNQTKVSISVYQGENNYCKDNTLLSTFELVGIREAPRMEPKIEVSLRIDANGILSVTAVDVDTNVSQSIKIVDMSTRAASAMREQAENSTAPVASNSTLF